MSPLAEDIHQMKSSVPYLITNLHMCRSAICSLFLFCPIISQVQSEMLKKWKRWKLGKDIDEEYRHTHSHTPHIKSGSIATGNLPDLHDNNVSNPNSPCLKKSPVPQSSGLPCSTAPEENRQLVVSYINGRGKGRATKSRHMLKFSLVPHRGTTSHASTTTENTCLEERAQFCSHALEGEETSVWEQPDVSPSSQKLSLIELIIVSDQCLSCANNTAWLGMSRVRQWSMPIRTFTAA